MKNDKVSDYQKFIYKDKLMNQIRLYNKTVHEDSTGSYISLRLENVLGNINYFCSQYDKPVYDIYDLGKLSTDKLLRFKNFGRKLIPEINKLFTFYNVDRTNKKGKR